MRSTTQHLTPQGPQFSRLVAGVWHWHELAAHDLQTLIATALEEGITTFDHADIYGGYQCEEVFGKVLAQHPSWRQRMQLVTKCGIRMVHPARPAHHHKHYDTSRAHIIASVENSLRMLHTDYIDLLLIHRPDPLMDAAEVAEAFGMLRAAGKVRYFGVSNFTPQQFDLLNAHVPLVTNQIEVSILKTQPMFDGTLDHLQARGVSPMAWSPLGSGKVFDTATTDPQLQALQQQLRALSERYGLQGWDQLLLAWLMRHPSRILPVLGTTKPERLRAAAAASHVDFDRQDWFALLEAARGYRVP